MYYVGILLECFLMVTILLGIGMFMFLVVIHEIGHFIAARKAKVKVEEFGVGIPPKVTKVRTDRQGTEYTLNWIPLGWFVRLKGENPDDKEVFLARDSFITASFRNKIIILLGGVTVNTVFARFAFSVAFRHGVYPLTIVPDSAIRFESQSYLMPTYSFLSEQWFLVGEDVPVRVESFLDNSLGESIWLQQGDTIVSINNVPVTVATISPQLQQHIWSDVQLTIVRNNEEQTLTVPCEKDRCFLGVRMQGSEYDLNPIKFPFWKALAMWFHELKAETEITFFALGNLFTSLLSFDKQQISSSVNKLSWPVGIVKFGEKVWNSWGLIGYLAFAGVISLALAIFNILPIPALDGGRIVGVIIQKVGNLKAESYYVIENYFNIFFFVLLLALWIYIIFMDLSRFRWITVPFFS